MTQAAPIGKAEVLDALREVMDPELNCNLVDLGLIYDVQVQPAGINVKMTLTTPGCPMHETLIAGVQAALSNLRGVRTVNVELVWDPPWTPELLSAEGRAQLGIYDH